MKPYDGAITMEILMARLRHFIPFPEKLIPRNCPSEAGER